jgi:hypothetical protein
MKVEPSVTVTPEIGCGTDSTVTTRPVTTGVSAASLAR